MDTPYISHYATVIIVIHVLDAVVLFVVIIVEELQQRRLSNIATQIFQLNQFLMFIRLYLTTKLDWTMLKLQRRKNS